MRLIKTLKPPKTCWDEWVNRCVVDVEDDIKEPGCEIDGDLYKEEHPRRFRGEQKQVTSSRMLEQKHERMVHFGMFRYEFRQ